MPERINPQKEILYIEGNPFPEKDFADVICSLIYLEQHKIIRGENEEIEPQVIGPIQTEDGEEEWRIAMTVTHYYPAETLAEIEDPESMAIINSREFEDYWRHSALDPNQEDGEYIVKLVNNLSQRYMTADEIEKGLIEKIVLGIFHQGWELPDKSKISQN